MIKVSVKMDPELHAKLKALADAEKRPLMHYIELLLKRHVAGKEKAA